MITLSYQEAVKEYLTVHLKPLVTAIDIDSSYPEAVLKGLGKHGFYGSPETPSREVFTKTLGLIEETAAICGSTAFSLWCHMAAMIYVRNAVSSYLRKEILPLLASGDVLGATGLSNPLKYYAGMESILLHATPVRGGYLVNGFLPYVSNLGQGHWFGIIAQVDENKRIAAFVPCAAEGLKIIERKDFLGLNGSATYNCRFQDVFIPEKWLIDEDADAFVRRIRGEFVLDQAGIGFGITRAAISGIRALKDKQGGVNQFLRQQPDELEERLEALRGKAYGLIDSHHNTTDYCDDVIQIRLGSSYLTLDAANAGMLHAGGGAYVNKSNASRRLREAYFVAVVTPAVKQLEKVSLVGWAH